MLLQLSYDDAPIVDVVEKRRHFVTNSDRVCVDHLMTVVDAHISTADGALDERFLAELSAFALDNVALSGELSENVTGSFDIDPATRVDVVASYRSGKIDGEFTWVGEEECGDDSCVGSLYTVATWTASSTDPE